MSAHDRYALALAMLDGDRDSRRILADLLEEQGDRRLAHWARKGGKTRQRRLELAIMLLPCREAIALAAECLHESSFRVDGNVAAMRLIEAVRQWHRGDLPDDEVWRVCNDLLSRITRIAANPYILNDRPDRFGNDSGAASLVDAIRIAVESGDDQDQIQRLASTREHDVLMRVRKVIATARSSFRFPPLVMPDGSVQHLDATGWQTERIKAVFQQLLTPEVASWPK